MIFSVFICISSLFPGEGMLSDTISTPVEVLIKGNCFDFATGRLLKSSITVYYGSNSVLRESDDAGLFNFGLPDTVTEIAFESNGYKSVKIPVNLMKSEENTEFDIAIPLVSASTPQLIRGYSEKSGTNTGPMKDKITEVEFFVNDIYNGLPLDAGICLVNRADNETRCIEVKSTESPPRLKISLHDTLRVEVNAPGYDRYAGSFFIATPVDDGLIRYTIRLTRPPNIFSVSFGASEDRRLYCIMRDESQDTPNPGKEKREVRDWIRQHSSLASFNFLKEEGKTWVLIQDVIPASYHLGFVSDNQPLFGSGERVVLKPGLNLKTVSLRLPALNRDVLLKSPAMDSMFWDSATLYFDQSQYVLSESTRLKLDSIVGYLLGRKEIKAEIKGHTDNVGRAELNQMLSEHRAKVIRSYLIRKGVADHRVHFSGKGSRHPVAPNDIEENKVKNRRAVVHFSYN